MRAIILAAGLGRRLRPYTLHLPKCLIKIGEKPILERQILLLRSCGIRNITVVCGFKAAKIRSFCKRFEGVKIVHNPFYAKTNSIISVWLTKNFWDSDLLVMNSDILIDKQLLKKIILNRYRFCVLVKKGDKDGYRVRISGGYVKEMSMNIPQRHAFGVYAGVTKVSKGSLLFFGHQLERRLESGFWNDWYEDIVSEMAGKGVLVKPVRIDSSLWFEIDTPAELLRARGIAKRIRL